MKKIRLNRSKLFCDHDKTLLYLQKIGHDIESNLTLSLLKWAWNSKVLQKRKDKNNEWISWYEFIAQ